MGFRDLFKFEKWVPDRSRTPPPIGQWPDHILTLNNKKFDDFIDRYPVAIVDFWAPWCAPCRTMTPRLRQVEKMYRGKAAFGKINVDAEPGLAKRYHVLGIPKLVFFSYGAKVTSVTGLQQVKDIQDKIDDILAKLEND